MNVIRVVMLVVSTSAILSCGHGNNTAELETSSSNIAVPIQSPVTWNKSEALTVGDRNKSAITPVTNASAIGLNPAHGQPGHRCDIAVGQPLISKPATQSSRIFNTVTAATAQNTTVPTTIPAPIFNRNVRTVTNPATVFLANMPPADGLNPKHGLPGHRCDIPVGQPLNSKPTQPANASTTSIAAAVAPADGLNPKHGLPGHRCDIAVGQPLNSKPPQSAVTPAPKTTSAQPADGLNPKHGQPGHRCDILVGQPLNSKPVQPSSQNAPVTPWKFPAGITKDSIKS